MKQKNLAFLTLAGCILAGCGNETTDKNDVAFATDKPRDVIVTTIPPLTWMAQEIAGDSIAVEGPLHDRTEIGGWLPDSSGIESLQSAGLIVINGAGLEEWVTKTALPTSRIVDTTADLSEPFIRYEDVVVHQHGPEGDQSLEGVNPRTWLDPVMAKHQASRIAEAASLKWPEHAEVFQSNLKTIHARLDQVDARLRSLESSMCKVTVLCSHPSYSYLARRYDWKVHTIAIDPAQTISNELLEAVQAIGLPEQQPIVLWRTAPDAETQSLLSKAGIDSVVFETGVGTSSIDLAKLMDDNLDRLSKAIGG